VYALLDEGAEVVVVDDLSTGAAERVADAASLEVVDIAVKGAVGRVVDAVRPRSIYQLAAQSR
jgi:UDP-glucose 4-epimerase